MNYLKILFPALMVAGALGSLIDKWAMISGGPADADKEDDLSRSLREMAEELESDE